MYAIREPPESCCFGSYAAYMGVALRVPPSYDVKGTPKGNPDPLAERPSRATYGGVSLKDYLVGHMSHDACFADSP